MCSRKKSASPAAHAASTLLASTSSDGSSVAVAASETRGARSTTTGRLMRRHVVTAHCSIVAGQRLHGAPRSTTRCLCAWRLPRSGAWRCRKKGPQREKAHEGAPVRRFAHTENPVWRRGSVGWIGPRFSFFRCSCAARERQRGRTGRGPHAGWLRPSLLCHLWHLGVHASDPPIELGLCPLGEGWEKALNQKQQRRRGTRKHNPVWG